MAVARATRRAADAVALRTKTTKSYRRGDNGRGAPDALHRHLSVPGQFEVGTPRVDQAPEATKTAEETVSRMP